MMLEDYVFPDRAAAKKAARRFSGRDGLSIELYFLEDGKEASETFYPPAAQRLVEQGHTIAFFLCKDSKQTGWRVTKPATAA